MANISGSGEFRAGAPGVVAFHGGNNVDLDGSMNLEEQPEPVVRSEGDEFQCAGGNRLDMIYSVSYE